MNRARTVDPERGKRIEKAIADAGMTNRTVAAALGLKSDEAVRLWTVGRNVPPDKMRALAKVVNKPSAWLDYGGDEPTGLTEADKDKTAQAAEMVAALAAKLPNDDLVELFSTLIRQTKTTPEELARMISGPARGKAPTPNRGA